MEGTIAVITYIKGGSEINHQSRHLNVKEISKKGAAL
jgi:hypothetical protein